jgi:cob(I)alamin adenosyltransferase
LAARLHLARTVTRRAERVACALAERERVNPAAMQYLNRLSDFLFVLARAANLKGEGDVLWQPGVNRG